jgi:Protein of unknown function (DUF2934)
LRSFADNASELLKRGPDMETRYGAVNRAALKQAITRRAQELYEARGRGEGHALQDWLQAEAEILRELGKEGELAAEASKRDRVTHELGPGRSRGQEGQASTGSMVQAPVTGAAFFNVKVDRVLYTVQYNPEHCDSYRPGMLRKGEPVELRFEDDKVFLKLPNSKELEAKIVRKAQMH